MISNKVKERLLKKNWYVDCDTEQQVDLVLQACDKSGITWCTGCKATERKSYKRYPVEIGFCNEDKGLTHSTTEDYKDSECENITDWFFNAIKNTDDNGKLTPQNAEQEHYVQILLAKMQRIPVEFWYDFDQIWDDSDSDSIIISTKYRIKSKPTPIPVSRKTWQKINKEFRFIVMDKNKHFYHCKNAPKSSDKTWLLYEVDHVKSPLIFDSNGINWETSLTERPEDV